MSGQHRTQLVERDVRLVLDSGVDECGMVLDPGHAAVTTLRLGSRCTVLAHQLPPADRACRAHPEPLRRGPARHPALNGGNHPVPQIT